MLSFLSAIRTPFPEGRFRIWHSAGNAVIIGRQHPGHRGNDERMQGNLSQPVFRQRTGGASVGILNGGDCQEEEEFLRFLQIFRIFLQF